MRMLVAALSCALCVAGAGGPALAQAAQVHSPGYSAAADLVAANFELLDLIERHAPEALTNPAFEPVRTALARRTETAAQDCERVLTQVFETGMPPLRGLRNCDVDRLRLTPEEARSAEAALARVYDASPALRAIVPMMRESGRFARHAKLPDRDFLLQAWRDALAGVDRLIRVYGQGEKPYFDQIDSVIYPVDGRYYRALLANLIRETQRQTKDDVRPYAVPLRLAMELMIANRRDDAARLARLEAQENQKTAARMGALDWSAWRYPLILVPGQSPEINYEPLNPNAKLRLRRAVEFWRAGAAPIIVVSGGTVRPVGTDVVEAVQMKRYLMEQHGIPEDAILVEPLARHTTTNLRNTVRLMHRYGAPMDRMSLVVGNSVPLIAAARFRERCERELGYVPFEPGARLDFEALEFRPVMTALHRDSSDPLDP